MGREAATLPPLPGREGAGGPADATRERLLQAAHELLFTRLGANVSVSEICARADANVAMVKYCFGGKDAMLEALLERVLGRLSVDIERLAALDVPPDEKLRRHVGEIVRNYLRYPYVNRLMTERLLAADAEAVGEMSRLFAVPARAFYAEILEAGRESAGWHEVDPTLFFFSVVGVCEFLFSGRALLEQAFGETLDADLVERYIPHVTRLVTHGLRAVGD